MYIFMPFPWICSGESATDLFPPTAKGFQLTFLRLLIMRTVGEEKINTNVAVFRLKSPN